MESAARNAFFRFTEPLWNHKNESQHSYSCNPAIWLKGMANEREGY